MNSKRLTKAERKDRREAETRFLKLVADLNSDTPVVRQEADKILLHNPEEIGRELRVRLESMTRERRQMPLLLLVQTVVLGIVIGAVCGLFDMFWPSSHHTAPYGALIANIGVGLWRWKQQRNQMTRILARFDDVRMVGVLAEAIQYGTSDTRFAARNALMRILPRMQASDAALLNPAQRERLSRTLNSADIPFILVILKAYEQIGGEAELLAVERLLQQPRLKFAVREAAETCLPFLRMRARQTAGSHTLLRPSANAATPDILLRPVVPTDMTDQAQLLRSSDA